MDDIGGDTDESQHPGKDAPPDGRINFAQYSIDQLRDLQYSLDRQAFPQNYQNLLAALRQKEDSLEAPQPVSDACGGRFTSRTGLLGWFQAKVARSPLYGAGSVDVGSSEIALRGWERNWLGVPVEALVSRDLADVRNVAQDGSCVRFEIKRKYLLPQRVEFWTEDTAHAEHLVGKLPPTKTIGFAKHWPALQDFNRRLSSVSGRPWITPLIVALNVVVFAAMALSFKKGGEFNLPELLAWGANFGPLTVNGQWWRLFTALFVHFNLAHLLFNMWALWNIGRLSERLFGRGALLVLYVASGIVASLTSVAWNPSLSSVGASGAIFGVFGAFLAFLWRQRSQMPSSMVRTHWISTLAFVVFNLFTGAIAPGIDNAAHVGGLLSGFFLGLLLARPLDRDIRRHFPVAQSLTAAVFLAAVFVLEMWQVKGLGSELTVPERFLNTHGAYVGGESKNLQAWNALALRAGAGTISGAELGRRFEQDILPFWQVQREQLKKETNALPEEQRAYSALVAEFTDLRYQWVLALIDAAKSNDSKRAADAADLMLKTTLVNAKLDRLGLRSRMDHRPRALAASPLVANIRHLFSGSHWKCVRQPSATSPSAAASDDKSDGPAVRDRVACRSQELFMAGDYQRLESVMNQYVGSLEDLPDGSSSYEGVVRGLADLFSLGAVTPEDAFGRTADWRRKVKNLTMSDLVESMYLREWAWAARGHGTADTISKQDFAIFTYRTEMAAAALEEVALRAEHNPTWYTESLSVGLDLEHRKEQLRTVFDAGVEKVPNYLPLYSAMLRALMPRWGGSYSLVEQFVNDIDAAGAAARGHERYAQLYSIYVAMEDDLGDGFLDTPVAWNRMKEGYQGLIQRYPNSNYILNLFAGFACRAQDRHQYSLLRPAIEKRFSSTAWPKKHSLASCDEWSASLSGQKRPAQITAEQLIPIESLGGIRLGMTQNELLAAKGKPIRQKDGQWIYETSDSKNHGELSAAFSPSGTGREGAVQSIEYSGDQASAPTELPYLIDLTSVQVIQTYGAQLKGNLTLRGEMKFVFRNGVYVDTLDEKVYRYGIIGAP